MLSEYIHNAINKRSFNFNTALELLKHGANISRIKWGKRKWLYPEHTSTFPFEAIGINISYDVPSTSSSNGFACKTIKWKPTVEDILADDWFEPTMGYYSNLNQN